MDNKGFFDEHGNYHDNQSNGKMEKNGNGHMADITSKDTEKQKPVDDKEVVVEYEDPWKVTSISKDYVPWNELNGNEKFLRVVGYFVKPILALGCLYMFICSLDFLSSAFKLLGGQAAGKVFQQNEILTNPVAGLMIGVLVTVLVQSSSTSTSIVVSMVGASILEIDTAIPIIMGANIGTSVTNTIVSLGQITDKGEFRRAFAGATVHDMFNWMSVIILLPIEIATGYLHKVSKLVVDSLNLPEEGNKDAKKDILKVITKPFTELIIKVDKKAIEKIAKGEDKDPYSDTDHAIMLVCCDKVKPAECCHNGLEKSFNYSDGSVRRIPMDDREDMCGGIREECLGRNSTSFPDSCLTAPFTEGLRKDTINATVIDCAALSSNETQTKCCTDWITDNFPYGDHTSACTNVSMTCFNSSFSMDQCLSSTKYMMQDYRGDDFSCARWTKEVENLTCIKECEFLFKGLYPTLNDKEIGAILLVISLLILCACLVGIVKLLHSLLQGPMALIIKKFVNANFPGPLSYFTGYLALLIGAGLTVVVQSSSIFTSTLTPLVGIGVIEIDRMYPMTLGSNIGTTTTAILSALANSGDKLRDALQVSFCHLFFNITGIILYYPLPFMRFPIPLAKFLGNVTAKYRWFAIVYIILMFFMLPGLVFVLSIPGWYVLAGVLGPFALLVIIIAIIKFIQAKRPSILPRRLQNWKFLPVGLRSLEPYDRVMKKIFFCSKFQNDDPIVVYCDDVPSKQTNGVKEHFINTRL